MQKPLLMRVKDIVELYKVDQEYAEALVEKLDPAGVYSGSPIYARKDIESILKKESK